MLYTSRCTVPGAAAFLRDLRKSYPLSLAALRWGNFLPAVSVQGRSAGPEAGRGVPTPPSLPLDSTHPALQQLRPPPAAETGSSCWGSGQQDASAAQGTKRMLGAATRRQGLLALDNPKEEVEAQKS